MKPVRLLLLLVGLLAVLSAVAVVLAFTPSVQRWAVLRAAAGRPGWRLRIDAVSAGPASFTVRGLQLDHDGLRLGLERLEGDYSLFQLLTGSGLELGRLRATGVTVDASHLSRNRVLAAGFATPAVVVQTRLPWEVVVGELHVEGRALLPGSRGRPPVKADFKLTGGHFAPGREGALRFTARLVDPLPGARVAALDFQAGLQIKQSRSRTFDRVGLTALVDATGPRISGSHQLKLVADLTHALAGDHYLLQVDTLSNGRAEDMLVVNARQAPAGAGYSGDWVLTAGSAQIEPFLIGGALPRFDARGTGTFSLNPATRTLGLQGSLQAGVSELETLQPALRALGAVKLTSDFDILADRGRIQLNKLNLTLAGERPVLDLHAFDAAAFNLPERRFEFAAPVPGGGPPRDILRLNLTGLPVAWIRPFLTVADVSGGAVEGEIVLANGEGRRLVARTAAPLRVSGVTVVRAGRTWFTQADLAVDAETELLPEGVQVRLRALTLATPAGDSLKVRAVMTVAPGPAGPVTVTGDCTLDWGDLPARWVPSGRLRARGAADGTVQPGRIEFRRLSLEAEDGRGQRLATVSLTRAFGLDPARLRADSGAAEVELARATIGRLPVGLFVRPHAGFALSGLTTPDEFSLSARGDGLVLQALSPLLLTDVTLTRGARVLFDRLTVEFSPRLELSDGLVSRLAGGAALIRDSTGAPLAKINAELVRAAGAEPSSDLSFTVDLPTLVGEPLFARAGALTAGQAIGEVRAAALGGGDVQIEARATLNGLVGRDGAQTLPVANLSLRSLVQSDGRFTVQAPLLLDRAGLRSDLSISAKGVHQGGVTTVDARLTGGHVELGDALLLAAAAGEPLGSDDPEGNGAASRALSPPAADDQAFWSGFAGRVGVDLKEVVNGHEWDLTGLTGQMAIAPEHLVLTNLAAGFGGGRLSAHGGLAFAPGLNPYRLSGDFALAGFELGRLFRAPDPESVATLEGTGDLQGTLEGLGLTLDDTLDRTRGRFSLASGKGVFRGLRRSDDKLSLASKAVRWSAAVGSWLRTDRVKEAAEKVAGNSYYVDQLAEMLAAFPYEKLTVRAVRDESLNLEIQDFELVAPEVHLRGRGHLSNLPGHPLRDQPLRLSLDLGGRGRVEQILGKLHVLDGTRDNLDYARTREPVLIGGTPDEPDPTAYFAGLLAEKAAK